jgi:hypothetical protein
VLRLASFLDILEHLPDIREHLVIYLLLEAAASHLVRVVPLGEPALRELEQPGTLRVALVREGGLRLLGPPAPLRLPPAAPRQLRLERGGVAASPEPLDLAA